MLPSDEWRRVRLQKTSIQSKIAVAGSARVFHFFVSSSSVCSRARNASTMALSKASPTVPSDWFRFSLRSRWLNAHDVYWPGSTGRRDSGLLEGV